MAHGEYKEVRGRNFAFVQKVENLPENWREICETKLVPMAYVVHDKDVHTPKPEVIGQHAKNAVVDEELMGMPVEPHVHFFVYFNGKRTASGVVNMFGELNIGYAERIECKNAYLAYMLHINEEDKHRYGYDELKVLNGLKVNFADLNNVDFGDVLDFAEEWSITRFHELVKATKKKDPPLFRYITGHYALVCAYFSDWRADVEEVAE